MGAMQGTVFNIQKFSIHDGPGIRTTVFVKGCPLRCIWCHNPESNRVQAEVMYYKNLCIACGRCVPACPQKLLSLEGQTLQVRHDDCIACGNCISACPKQARELMGHLQTADEVFEEVARDHLFYKHSGGGVTISGGEPLSQPEFVSAILKCCSDRNIHTCIETCGFADRKAIDQVMPYTNIVLYDIKHLNDSQHKALTGVSNKLILDNLRYIALDLKKEIWLRMPLISGVNDDADLIRQTAEFILPLKQYISNVYLLPYHTLGISKLEALGRSTEPCIGYQPPKLEHLEILSDVWKSYGFTVHISGH